MAQTKICDFKAGTVFEGHLLVRSADRRTSAKTGKDFLAMTLADASGEVTAMLWDGLKEVPTIHSVIRVRGQVQEYNGRIQLRVESMHPRQPNEQVDMSLLVASSVTESDLDGMLNTLRETAASFRNEALRKITLRMLTLAGADLRWFPGGQRIHHAERGGLLRHTLGMLKAGECLLPAYPFLDGELLKAGIIIHDLGKIREMKPNDAGMITDYTADGILIGHLIRGVAMIDEAARLEGIEGETVLLLEHMMLSHHGQPEYGSPKLPMFPEAEVLHTLDLLDARMDEMSGVLRRTPEGQFSEKVWSLDRRLYRRSEDSAV